MAKKPYFNLEMYTRKKPENIKSKYEGLASDGIEPISIYKYKKLLYGEKLCWETLCSHYSLTF